MVILSILIIKDKIMEKAEAEYKWGRGCSKCIHCKMRTFRDWEKFKEFLESKEYSIRTGWRDKFIRQSFSISAYWCDLSSGRGKLRITTTDITSGHIKRTKCQHLEEDNDGEEEI
jgi:hypothetical protein